MKKSIAMKWVAELRSGKHRQTRGALKKADGSMCCLGVLCAEALKMDHVLTRGKRYFTFYGEGGKLPLRARRLSDVATPHGYLLGERLTELNDYGLPSEGLEPFTFDEIADLIQINWKDL